jgi:hypothetical protein
LVWKKRAIGKRSAVKGKGKKGIGKNGSGKKGNRKKASRKKGIGKRANHLSTCILLGYVRQRDECMHNPIMTSRQSNVSSNVIIYRPIYTILYRPA